MFCGLGQKELPADGRFLRREGTPKMPDGKPVFKLIVPTNVK
jgi:hypothetical protein